MFVNTCMQQCNEYSFWPQWESIVNAHAQYMDIFKRAFSCKKYQQGFIMGIYMHIVWKTLKTKNVTSMSPVNYKCTATDAHIDSYVIKS